MPLNNEPLHQEAIRPVQAAPRHTGILPCVAFKHFAMRLRGRRSAAQEVVRTAAGPDSRGEEQRCKRNRCHAGNAPHRIIENEHRDKDRQADNDRDQHQKHDIQQHAGRAIRLVQEEYNVDGQCRIGVPVLIISRRSATVLLGSKYAPVVSNRTCSAWATIGGDESARIRLIMA
jgi:hypothetical protein